MSPRNKIVKALGGLCGYRDALYLMIAFTVVGALIALVGLRERPAKSEQRLSLIASWRRHMSIITSREGFLNEEMCC